MRDKPDDDDESDSPFLVWGGRIFFVDQAARLGSAPFIMRKYTYA